MYKIHIEASLTIPVIILGANGSSTNELKSLSTEI